VSDVSPPSGRPDDGRGDAPAGIGGADAARRTGAPRHLAGARGRPATGQASEVDAVDPIDDELDVEPGHDDRRDGGDRHVRSLGRTIVEWLLVIGCGVLIAVGAREFLVQAFWIPSPSMSPTLEVDDRVLVNKLSYLVHDVNHGDLVVFERPPEASNGEDGEIKDLIKRVIAVGGDTIECHDSTIYVNGEGTEEPYLVDGMPACGGGTCELDRQQIPDGMVFVMGDNRTNSEDSRCFGPIDEDTIVGRAFITVLPLSHLGWL
jgi:signal peptidase I